MIGVLIIDDSCQSCDQLAKLVESQSEMHVLDCVAGLPEAMPQIQMDGCSVVLVSAALPDGGAFILSKRLQRSHPDIPVLAVGLPISMTAELHLLEAGIRGYLSFQESQKAILDKIRAAAGGGAILDPLIAGVVLARLSELIQWIDDQKPDLTQAAKLTDREWEVLQLIGCKLSNQEIANQLIIEVGTVKNHVHNILAKLKVDSRHEAAGFLPIAGSNHRREWKEAAVKSNGRPALRRQVQPLRRL